MNEKISMTIARRIASLLAGTTLAVLSGSSTFGQEETQSPATTSDGSKAIAGDLYQFPPTSPTELLEAARVTQKLDRVADSRAFLRKILDLQLGENELQAFRDEVGASPFLDLRSDIRLQPESAQLLTAVNQAIKSKSYTTQELQDLAAQLGTRGFVGTRAAAELMSSGESAIPVLLAVAPDSPSAVVSNQILARNARPWRSGLLKQLETADSTTRIRILDLLGLTADSELAVRLLRWKFDPSLGSDVTRAAHNAITRLLDGQQSVESGAEAVDVLTQRARSLLMASEAHFSDLNQAELLVDLTGQNPRVAKLEECRALLSDALAIEPENQTTLEYSLIVECAALKNPLNSEPSLVAGKSAAELQTVLNVALDLRSEAAIEILRGLKTLPAVDNTTDEAVRVLNRALLSPDARVRCLAASIGRNQQPLSVNAAAVSRFLMSAKNGSLKPEVVIVSGNASWRKDRELVFRDAGYAPQVAAAGPEGFELAASQLNCELFVLDAESPRWPIATTLANLRADVRTQNTTVVVIGDSRFRDRVEALAQIYPGVWFLPEPAGSESLIAKLAQQNIPAIRLSAEDRAAMVKLAE